MIPRAAHGTGDYRAWLEYEAEQARRELARDRLGRLASDCQYVAEPVQEPVRAPVAAPAEPQESWIDEWRRSWPITDRLRKSWAQFTVKELLQLAREGSYKAARAERIDKEKSVLKDVLAAYSHLGA